MKFLLIENSDGDTLLQLHDGPPDLREFQDVQGMRLVEDEPDTNYWPEGTCVVLRCLE